MLLNKDEEKLLIQNIQDWTCTHDGSPCLLESPRVRPLLSLSLYSEYWVVVVYWAVVI